mgnify:FL=1
MRDKVTKEIKIYGKEDDHGRHREFIRSWKKAQYLVILTGDM